MTVGYAQVAAVALVPPFLVSSTPSVVENPVMFQISAYVQVMCLQVTESLVDEGTKPEVQGPRFNS